MMYKNSTPGRKPRRKWYANRSTLESTASAYLSGVPLLIRGDGGPEVGTGAAQKPKTTQITVKPRAMVAMTVRTRKSNS